MLKDFKVAMKFFDFANKLYPTPSLCGAVCCEPTELVCGVQDL